MDHGVRGLALPKAVGRVDKAAPGLAGAALIHHGVPHVNRASQPVPLGDQGDVPGLLETRGTLAGPVPEAGGKAAALKKALNIAVETVGHDKKRQLCGKRLQHLGHAGVEIPAVLCDIGVFAVDAGKTDLPGPCAVLGEKRVLNLLRRHAHDASDLTRVRPSGNAEVFKQGPAPALGHDAAGVPERTVQVKDDAVDHSAPP